MARRVQVPCRHLLREGGNLFYLYLARVSCRCWAQALPRRLESAACGPSSMPLFVTFFYLGFIRKWKHHSIMTSDQDNEKIREVAGTSFL